MIFISNMVNDSVSLHRLIMRGMMKLEIVGLCLVFFLIEFFFLQQLKYLSYNELTDKMSNLDQEMEREIDDLRRRYHAKRQPILDAMDQKRKRQQNF